MCGGWFAAGQVFRSGNEYVNVSISCCGAYLNSNIMLVSFPHCYFRLNYTEIICQNAMTDGVLK